MKAVLMEKIKEREREEMIVSNVTDYCIDLHVGGTMRRRGPTIGNAIVPVTLSIVLVKYGHCKISLV